MMKVLVIGAGGREHALAWQCAKDNNVDAVLVGVADILVKPYKEICERLGLPCYATDGTIEAFCSKDEYKRYCEKYDYI